MALDYSGGVGAGTTKRKPKRSKGGSLYARKRYGSRSRYGMTPAQRRKLQQRRAGWRGGKKPKKPSFSEQLKNALMWTPNWTGNVDENEPWRPPQYTDTFGQYAEMSRRLYPRTDYQGQMLPGQYLMNRRYPGGREGLKGQPFQSQAEDIAMLRDPFFKRYGLGRYQSGKLKMAKKQLPEALAYEAPPDYGYGGYGPSYGGYGGGGYTPQKRGVLPRQPNVPRWYQDMVLWSI